MVQAAMNAAAGAITAAGGRPTPLWRTRVFPLGALYAAVFLFFAVIWVSGARDSPLNVATAGVFLTIRLLGAGIGLWKLKRAGFNRRLPAHWMLLALSGSLLFGALGTVIWLTYNLTGVLVPYPSWGDVGYGGHTLLWAAGLFCFFVVLDTSPREELGPFLGLLTATWSLTVLLISLIQGARVVTVQFPKIAFDIFYPAVWALNCALVGSLLLGPRYKQLTKHWRGFIVLAYTGALVLFLTNIAYGITAAIPVESTAAGYLYYNGGPLDFLFATGNYFLLLGIVLLPLGQPVFRAGSEQRAPAKETAPLATLIAQPLATPPVAEIVTVSSAVSPPLPQPASPSTAAYPQETAVAHETIETVLDEVGRLRDELVESRQVATRHRRRSTRRPAASRSMRAKRSRRSRRTNATAGRQARQRATPPARTRWAALHRTGRSAIRPAKRLSVRRFQRRAVPLGTAHGDRTVLTGAIPP